MFTDEDVRYTFREHYLGYNHIYAIVLGKPKEEIMLKIFTKYIKLIEDEIVDVNVVGVEKKVEWSIDTEGLKIRLPVDEIKIYPYVIRIIVKKNT